MNDYTEYVDLSYKVGGHTYDLTVEMYFPVRGDWADIEIASITFQGTDGPDLFELFEAIDLPPADPSTPRRFRRSAADDIADQAIAQLRG